ncbi:MAG: GIY-YIG nuclease family protein [Synechococcaceae cyanobacterium SM2_3_2]|nr:GIY-YIG nuclease family protein [Synechococcaceae cyanobacterium SM2_3_2]
MQPHTQGIKRAVQEAKRASLLLEKGEFDWSEWIGDQSQVSGPPVGELAARYEQWFFATKGETASTRYTWEKDYLAVYRKIPNDAHLTEAFIISLIQASSEPNTRSRKRYTQALKKLAEFAELPIRMKKIQQLSGNYGRPGTLKPRKLLTDQEIIEIWSLLDNPIAKYMWGLMACFGCRSHEVWLVDTSALLEERDELPGEPGIYFVLDQQNITHYIGMSANIQKRWFSHYRQADFNEIESTRILYIPGLPKHYLREIESFLIKSFLPSLNIKGKPIELNRIDRV